MKKLSKNEIAIVEMFIKNIFLKTTIREIALRLKKSYPKIYEAVMRLEKRGIINIDKTGHSNLCSLKLSPEAISIISFFEIEKALSKGIINMKNILERPEFFDDIIIVTGSYAKDKETAKSDIDVAVIAKKDAYKKQKLLENLTLTLKPEVHPIVFTYKNFIDMLTSREENFGKEIFKNHLIFRNAERYYILIKEAMANDFRI